MRKNKRKDKKKRGLKVNTRSKEIKFKKKRKKFLGLQRKKICGSANYIMTSKTKLHKMDSKMYRKARILKIMGDSTRKKHTSKENKYLSM